MEKNKFWLILVFAVVVYLILGVYADFDKLLSALESFDWIFFLLLLALTTLGYFIRFIRWNFFLKQVGVNLKLSDNLFVYFSGLCMTITPAKAGEIWKGWLIKEINGESLSKTVPVVISDRLIDILALVFLSLLGIIYYKQGAYVILIILLLFAVFVLAIRSPKNFRQINPYSGGKSRKILQRCSKYARNIPKNINTKKSHNNHYLRFNGMVYGMFSPFHDHLRL